MVERIKKLRNKQPYEIYPMRKFDFSEEYKRILIELNKMAGIYMFYRPSDEDEKIIYPLYVGMSQNLGHRMASSFADKYSQFRRCGKVLAAYLTTLRIDAAIYEILYINHYEPTFNKKLNYNTVSFFSDKITYEFDEIDLEIGFHYV